MEIVSVSLHREGTRVIFDLNGSFELVLSSKDAMTLAHKLVELADEAKLAQNRKES